MALRVLDNLEDRVIQQTMCGRPRVDLAVPRAAKPGRCADPEVAIGIFVKCADKMIWQPVAPRQPRGIVARDARDPHTFESRPKSLAPFQQRRDLGEYLASADRDFHKHVAASKSVERIKCPYPNCPRAIFEQAGDFIHSGKRADGGEKAVRSPL